MLVLRLLELVHQVDRGLAPHLGLDVREVPEVLQYVPGHLEPNHGGCGRCVQEHASASFVTFDEKAPRRFCVTFRQPAAPVASFW